MTNPTITPRSMARRKLVADAELCLSNAMHKFTREQGELTPAEWQAVLIQKMQWTNQLALKEEWEG